MANKILIVDSDVRTIPDTFNNAASKIKIVYSGFAEDIAMLQALNSRSLEGLDHHLKELLERGSGKFMEKFYVGYGHKSVGDLGVIEAAFFQKISMLAAKALQDNGLYNGQESSTRYMNYAEQPIMNPLATEEGRILQEEQRRFYLSIVEQIIPVLKEENPKPEGISERQYENAIRARAFDITRSFLPAGTSTVVSWNGTLRNFNDRLLFLRHHPLEEVKLLSVKLEELLKSIYPHSFGGKRYEKTEEYQDLIAKMYYYHNPNSPNLKITDNLNDEGIIFYKQLLVDRPPKTELPKFLASELGTLTVEYTLDFGSFRDLQRHRAIVQRMPLLTTDLGFNEWYLNALPDSLRTEAESYLESLEKKINSLDTDEILRQYYIPMGFNVSGKFSGDVPAIVYFAELRSSNRVHPTLRPIAQEIGDYLSQRGILTYIDRTPDGISFPRGKDTIERK